MVKMVILMAIIQLVVFFHLQLRAETKTAQTAFAEVLEYYGESSRSMAPNTFFAIFARFTKAYKVSC